MIHGKIGRYEVLAWRGGGQFADVFLVKDPLTETQYALKLSRAKRKTSESFLQEARILASLNHPNIVRFYTVDFYQDRLFILLEYIEGKSLREIIQERAPLSQDEALRIALEILDALAYAHAKGVLHRDLKPENILLTPDMTVKITDFGLSALISGNVLEASVAGTPLYMAPEVWEGRFSPASDLWAFSAILYEMLAGHAPFFAETLEQVRAKILTGRIPKIHGIRPELMRILRRGLHPNPRSRYASAEDFRKDLEALFKKKGKVFGPIEIKRSGPRDLLESLTEEQRTAVTHGDGITLVLGGPGTGKTTTLIARAVYLIRERGVDPETLWICTFTGRGVFDLQERFTRHLGKEVVDALWLGTYHTLAMRIVAFAGERYGIPEDFTVINESRQYDYLRKAARTSNTTRLRAMMKTISFFKANLMSPKEILTSGASRWEQEVAEVYLRYQSLLREDGVLDFGDLLLIANQVLRDYDDIRETLAGRFRFVLADEFQDVDFAQYQLLKQVASVHHNLFVTGDDDQAIYGFRGASPKFMEDLLKEFPDAQVFHLTQNFRTPEDILDLATNLISRNTHRFQKVIYARNPSRNSVIFHIARNERDEAQFVAQKIIEHHEEGYAFDDMAVFYRVHSRSRLFEEVFRIYKIPYNIVGASSFFQRPEVRAALAVLRLLVGPIPRAEMQRILQHFTDLTAQEIRNVLKSWDKRQKPTFSRTLPPAKRESLKNLWALVQELRDMVRLRSPYDLLQTFFEQTGFWKILTESEMTPLVHERENLQELLAMASDFGKDGVRDFLNYVQILESFGAERSGTGGVRLMTVHSAKGTEFPIVFLVGLEKNSFPLRGSLVRKQDLEEERRLFYVAMTRAQERLYLTYARSRQHTSQEASPFLNELLMKTPT